MWEIGVSIIYKLLRKSCGRVRDRKALENTEGQEEPLCVLQNTAEDKNKMAATSQREVSPLPEAIELVAARAQRVPLLPSLSLSRRSGFKTGK